MLDKLKKMLSKEETVPELQEIEPTTDQIEQMQRPADFDPDYLTYSAEAVGFANREQQWNTYRIMLNYIGGADSVIDFGCGRGDFMRFLNVEFPEDSATVEYIGVDMNEQLYKASLDNDDLVAKDILNIDWFDLKSDIQADWCINVNSNNVRYDANIKLDDNEYTKATIEKMYEHANQGVAILLTTKTNKDSGLIDHNPGELLNWAMEKFGNVAVDHTMAADSFVLLIYKN